jgi:formylglycine-generating enzyme required for sulfatase activity
VIGDLRLDLVSVLPGQYRRPSGGVARLTRPFALQRTPVTVSEYRRFLDETGHPVPARIEAWDGAWKLGPSFWDANAEPQQPVVGVAWDDARAFVAWLSARTGLACRLPSEAEYRYAAQGGRPCAEPCHHAAGLPAHFISGVGRAAMRTVARGRANELGLFDMHGLVWQWCSDWYDDLAVDADSTDPLGPPAPPPYVTWQGERLPPGRVICGGSFSYPAEYSSCHHRHYSPAADRNFNLGMRVAVTPPPSCAT